MKKTLSILFFVSVNFALAQDVNSRSQNVSAISNSSGTLAATSDGNARSQTASVFSQSDTPNTSGDNRTSGRTEGVGPAEDKRIKNDSGKKPK